MKKLEALLFLYADTNLMQIAYCLGKKTNAVFVDTRILPAKYYIVSLVMRTLTFGFVSAVDI